MSLTRFSMVFQLFFNGFLRFFNGFSVVLVLHGFQWIFYGFTLFSMVFGPKDVLIDSFSKLEKQILCWLR